MKTPFVKKIRTRNKFYAYDVNTNHLLLIPEIIYHIIDDVGLLSRDEIVQKYANTFSEDYIIQGLEKIQEVQESGLLLDKRPAKVKLVLQSDKELSPSSLALEVTESCNLRCGYCLYCSQEYPTYRESSEQMTFEIGKQAIDLFAQHASSTSESLLIGFYGGEPIINLDLIKKLIEYSKTKLDQNRLGFTLTSNGTLLTQEVMDYLVQEKVILTLSLDGPEKVHDRMRVRVDQSGTFQDVLTKVMYFRDKYPDYYKQNLNFSAVLTPPFDFLELDQFFSQFPVRVLPSLMEYNDTIAKSVKKRVTAPGWEDTKNRFKDLIRDPHWGPHYRSHGGSFIFSLFALGLRRLLNRDLDVQPFDGVFEHTFGFCYPGDERLFVNTTGQIYLCEKVDGNEVTIIGDVWTGIDPVKVEQLLDIFEHHDYQTCQSCWLVRFCSICPARILYANQIDQKKMAFNCQNSRELYEELLQMFCEIMEEDENLLDFLA